MSSQYMQRKAFDTTTQLFSQTRHFSANQKLIWCFLYQMKEPRTSSEHCQVIGLKPNTLVPPPKISMKTFSQCQHCINDLKWSTDLSVKLKLQNTQKKTETGLRTGDWLVELKFPDQQLSVGPAGFDIFSSVSIFYPHG